MRTGVVLVLSAVLMATLAQDWFRLNLEYENNIQNSTSKHIPLHSSPAFPDMSPLREFCLQREGSEQPCRVTQSHLQGEKDLPFCSHVGVSAQVIPRGLASRSGLRVGDRILEVNSIDLRHATHQEAVNALLSNAQELTMVVRRDPPPPGMQVGSEQGGWGGITQGGFWVQFLTRLEV